MKNLVIPIPFIRSTKNKHFYSSVIPEGVIANIYIPRNTPLGTPDFVEVVIKQAEVKECKCS